MQTRIKKIRCVSNFSRFIDGFVDGGRDIMNLSEVSREPGNEEQEGSKWASIRMIKSRKCCVK